MVSLTLMPGRCHLKNMTDGSRLLLPPIHPQRAVPVPGIPGGANRARAAQPCACFWGHADTQDLEKDHQSHLLGERARKATHLPQWVCPVPSQPGSKTDASKLIWEMLGRIRQSELLRMSEAAKAAGAGRERRPGLSLPCRREMPPGPAPSPAHGAQTVQPLCPHHPTQPQARMLRTQHPCGFLPPPFLTLRCASLWGHAEGGLGAAARAGAAPPPRHPPVQQ